MRKMISFIVSMLGIALFVYGSNISEKISFQEGRITQAESSSQQGRPTIGPVRRAVKNEEKQNQQQMLSQKSEQAAVAQIKATWLQGIGAALFIIGIGAFFFGHKKKN